MDRAAIRVLFIEFPELYFHIDPYLDSVYTSGNCRFHFYFFLLQDFDVPLAHPQFDPSAPYIAIPLYMAHPFPPPAAAAAAPAVPLVAPPVRASPPQVVPSLFLDEEEDPS